MRFKSIASLLALVFLLGCVGVSYKEIPIDSAPPNHAYRDRCQGSLAKGQTCLARIPANQWSTATGLRVGGPGERYCLSVPPNQVWFDATRRRTPPWGEQGSFIMRLAPLRHPNAGYFALMVDVPTVPGFAVSPTARAVETPEGARYLTPAAGSLVLYPNDALGPTNAPDWYYTSNNHGFIWVSIRRCDD